MPCNSDYMEASHWEIEMSKVAYLLDELAGKGDPPNDWNRGYHPEVYNGKITKDQGDKMVSDLCRKLQRRDVSKCSLEMQLWWRDHQKADQERLKKEAAEAVLKRKRQEALAKLTDYERELLGLQ